MPAFSLAQAFSPFGVGSPVAVPGEEAEEAQDAQIILADARLRIADEAHAPGFQIVQSAERIEELAVQASQ